MKMAEFIIDLNSKKFFLNFIINLILINKNKTFAWV